MSLCRRFAVRIADLVAGRRGRRDLKRQARRDQLALSRLRAENPSCRIDSMLVEGSRLGESAVVAERTRLSRSVLGNYASLLAGASLDRVELGDFSYVSYNSTLSDCQVGRFCSIGQNVRIGLAPHPTRGFVSMYPAFYSASNSGCARPLRQDSIFDESVPPTRIGNDVWIGSEVLIPGGIHVGTGAAIAAGSVVVKDVPPYAIVGGNPATLIRYRFPQETIDALLASEWWNWSLEDLQQRVDWFADVERFVRETS